MIVFGYFRSFNVFTSLTLYSDKFIDCSSAYHKLNCAFFNNPRRTTLINLRMSPDIRCNTLTFVL